MSNIVVVGAQWGDEGKGRIVDWLAEKVDIVARYNGGHNAGHTLVVDGVTYKLALIPSGVVRGKLGFIGNGVALDPEAFLSEIERLRGQGVLITPENLVVAETTTLVLPIHRALDRAQEELRSQRIGTTLRGIGPAYEDKVGRRGVRVCDLATPDVLSDKLDTLLSHHNAWFRGLGLEEIKKESILPGLLAIAPHILQFAGPVWSHLNNAYNDGKRTLFEGSQAVMLDVDWGSYPFVTSSSTVAAGAASGTGIGIGKVGKVLGVSKVYATRVGEGPFPTEDRSDLGALLRERGQEFGVNTGRPRRCGWLDAAQLRQAVIIAGINSLALTKIDVFDGLERVRVGVGYNVDGKRVDFLPPHLSPDSDVIPIYEDFQGWKQPTKGIRSFSGLPIQAQAVIKRVEALAGVPVSIITTGPERGDTIVMNEPFV